MTDAPLFSRRMAIAEMGKAGLAIAVLGIAACSNEERQSDSTNQGGSSNPETSVPPVATSSTVLVGSSYRRINLGFVNAYILYRGGEAAVVDTGISGSEEAIQAALGEIGLGWDAVGHVIVTHKHPDHQGSLAAVLALAPADLVVVDLLMPGMNGVRTVQAIRLRFPGMRILVATGAHDVLADDVLGGAAWLGDASTLSKPFDEPEFLGAVRALLADT